MEIVSFEIATKLKAKGFDYPCIGHYVNNQLYVAHYQNAFHSDNNESVDAPAISQVLKWLRKKKNIFVVTFIADDSDAPLTYEIYLGTECLLTHHGEYFTLQEWDKCNLVGIEYVLNNLI